MSGWIGRADLEAPGRQVDPRHLVPDAHVDQRLVTVFLCRPDDELLDVVDLTADDVRDAARGVAGPFGLLERDDLEGRIESPGLRRGGHAPGIAPDDRQPSRPRARLRNPSAGGG
jgi:hypothetical protein